MPYRTSCPSLAGWLKSALLSVCLLSAGTALAAEETNSVPSLDSLFNSLGNFLSGTTGELRGLVDKGELDRAAALYLNKRLELDKSADAQPVLKKLADGLNQRAAPQWVALTRQLQDIQPMAGPERWPVWTQLIEQSVQQMNKNAMDPLLSRAEFQSPECKALKAELDKAMSNLVAAVPRQFAVYDLAVQPDFFAAYPPVFKAGEQEEILIGRMGAMVDTLSSSSTARATLILKNYLDKIDDAALRRQLIQGWINAYAREKNWKNLTLAQKLEANSRLNSELPDLNVRASVAVLPVFGADTASDRRTLAQSRAEALAKRLDAELLPAVEYTEAPQQSASLRSKYDLIVLADIGRLSGGEVVAGTSMEQGRFLARNDVLPNPEQQRLSRELAEAQNRLARAEAERRQAEQQAKTMATQSQGMAALGMLTATTSIFSAGNAKEEVDRILYQLRKTPGTISTPVYENYQRQVVTRRVMAVAPVSLYVIDTGRNVVQRITQPVVESLEYKVYDNPHPADPDAKQMTPEAKQAQREALIKSVLTNLPEELPSLEKMVALAQVNAMPFDRLPKLIADEQGWFKQEADRQKMGLHQK